jgi:transcriptional regulator with XRE-family HTH domain
MSEINEIFAKNLVKLRKDRQITQLELAEALNYSDRNISKWENGLSLPPVDTLVDIAHYFGVTTDYLLTEHPEEDPKLRKATSKSHKTHLIILGLSVLFVYLIMTVLFLFVSDNRGKSWLFFVYGVPVASIIAIVFIALWFKKKPWLFIAISVLIWSLITSVYLSFLILGGQNYYLLFLIGIPLQIAVLISSRFPHVNNK